MTATIPRPTRRRVLSLIGATASAPLFRAWPASASTARILDWHGRTLGAETRILLAGLSDGDARRAIARCLEEVDRLEAIFSLYRPESEISRLNRDGMLMRTSLDLRLVVGESLRLSRLTGGAFDISVQPLWRLYANHGNEEPCEAAIRRALDLVDYRQVAIEGPKIAFSRPGMAITLNGVAQGYVTDRVVTILRDAGIARTLVQMGETRALGPPPGETGWPIQLPGPSDVSIADEAVATSAPLAETFGGRDGTGHILDPRSGLTPAGHDTVSVFAPSALTADGLSTALSLLPPDTDVRGILREMGAREAAFRTPDGVTKTVAV